MNNLYEEYNTYNQLIAEKQELNDELATLVNRQDNDSINKINELAKKISDVNTSLSHFDISSLEILDRYYQRLKELEKVIDDIKLIEKISMKSNGEKVSVISAEGRKKSIDNEYVLEYQVLTSKKKKLREKNTEDYKSLKGISSLINKPKVEEPVATTTEEYILPEIDTYDNLSLEDKIKMKEDEISRIIASNKLPNMGKKVLVSYNGKKYSIPQKYKGRFDNAIVRLNSLLKTRNNEPKRNKIVAVNDNEENKYYVSKLNLPTIEEMIIEDMVIKNKNTIYLHPIDVTFRKPIKAHLNKAFVCVKKRINVETFMKQLPSVYNIDKRMLLTFEKMSGRLLDLGIQVKTSGVKFARGAIMKYNVASSYVTSTSKAVSNYASLEYSKFRQYLDDKKKIISNVKEGHKVKESMENIYGESKEDHLDYRIVNRVVKFSENTCQRINETRGNIARVSKSVIDKVSAPFINLRENMQNDVQRKELASEIERIKRENLNKKNELKRIKIKENGGYIAMGSLMVVSTVLVAAIIFIIIGNLLR